MISVFYAPTFRESCRMKRIYLAILLVVVVQAGAQPMTSVQYLLELQRDGARAETYDVTTGLATTFGGAYGLGIIYAKAMLGPHASEAGIAA